MTQKEFETKRREALENMRQMNSRSKNPHTETPKEKEADPTTKPTDNTFGTSFKPTFSLQKIDPDTALIMGLIFLLATENCDKKLLFALMYILL